MNPAASLLFSLAYSLLMAFKETVYVVDFLPLFFLLIIQRTSLLGMLRQLLVVQLFLVFIVLGIGILHQDWSFAWLVFVRSLAIVSFNLMLFWKRDSFEIYQGMERLKVPIKLNLLLFFMLKYIEILKREFKTRREALKARGFVRKTNLHSYRTYAGMLGMMIYHGFLRTDRLNESLLARGFKGKMYTLQTTKITISDYIMVGLLGLQFFWLLKESV